ncbi:MAG: 3-phosphoshikimate 1-carboxyvinyltransferase [Planctomycetota bacterium]|nr:3-phosphoshikimate 1-carboxyvinyltransferase [Planctomycetota bacterium]
MDLLVQQSQGLSGTVHVPPNKSHSFRALIMASLAEGKSRIISPAVSADWLRGTEAMEMFGAEIEPSHGDSWEIIGTAGRLNTPDEVINCGNSGIIFRFFTAISACCDGYTVLTGDDSIRHIRPCGPLIEALNSLDAWAVSTKSDGHAPVVVRGPIKGGSAEIDGSDSQPVSALLIAASLAESPTELIVRNPGEKPWVEVTLHWLKRCGVEIASENFERYRIPAKNRWEGFDAVIPGDWSAAMYPIAAGLICPESEVRIAGVDPNDVQGDKAVLNILREMGADIKIEDDGAVVARSSVLQGRQIDCNDFIDQFMLLAVIAACCEGETVLTGAEICRHKECDRITEMHRALTEMGADVEERPDGLVVRGGKLRGAKLDSRADHRMVMTLAVAGLAAKGETIISDVECVKKTFPSFIRQMAGIGCDVQKQ